MNFRSPPRTLGFQTARNRSAACLLTLVATACLGKGRPLAEYAKQMEAYQAGLAAADVTSADATQANDAFAVDGKAEGVALDTGLADVGANDTQADVAKDTGPDLKQWASDGYVKPPGDPTCAVIETAGICSNQDGLPTIKVTLNFHNTCDKKTLRLYWYDSKCKANKYGEVGPGQWLTQQTFLGHAWRIVDSNTDELVAEYLVTTFPGGDVNLP